MLVSKTEKKLTEIKKTTGRIHSGFDPPINYIDILWRTLVVKPYLAISSRYNDLISKRGKRLLSNILKRKEEQKIDKKLVQQITTQVAENISNKIEERLKKIKIIDKGDKQRIKIKTDYIPQVEDESLNLVSNIDKIGPKLEKEKLDIEASVKLLNNIQEKS